MEIPVLFWILAFTFANSLISFIGIFTLWMKDKSLAKILFVLVAFSAGSLLGGALLHLLPEALLSMGSMEASLVLITGFSVFFLMEKLLHWHHCHEGKCDVHPYSQLIVIGDGIHNFIDGLVIAASFIVNPALGVITTLVIISHEVPQELGDFAVMVHGGMKKKKALFYNFLSQLTCMAGGVIGYLFGSSFGAYSAVLLPFAAGGFIYIAASDLIPELHKETNIRKSMMAFGFFMLGILLMLFMKVYFGG